MSLILPFTLVTEYFYVPFIEPANRTVDFVHSQPIIGRREEVIKFERPPDLQCFRDRKTLLQANQRYLYNKLIAARKHVKRFNLLKLLISRKCLDYYNFHKKNRSNCVPIHHLHRIHFLCLNTEDILHRSPNFCPISAFPLADFTGNDFVMLNMNETNYSIAFLQ